MLFTQKETVSEEPNREWPDPTSVAQKVQVRVDKCRYTVSGSYGKWGLELECSALVGPLAGLRISATFEVLEPFETPRRLLDHWGTIPERIEGTCVYGALESAVNEDYFQISIFCEERAVTSIFRSIQMLADASSSAVLEFEFAAHDRRTNGFWKTEWKDAEMKLHNWRLICETPQRSAQKI